MPAIEVSPGITISYERTGSGPSMLLVHGITESHHSWDPLVPALAEHFDVIAVDLRGHGASSSVAPYDAGVFAADLAGLATLLGLVRPYLVGHSLGGVVVTALATAIETSGVIDIDQPLALSGFQAALQPAASMIRGSKQEFEGFVAAMFAGMDGPLPAAERARINASARPDQVVVSGIWGGVLDGTAKELDAMVDGILAGVRAPFLALHGIDPGPDYASWLTARLPDATVEVWADHGHYPHLVDPARFVDRVLEFTRQQAR